MLVHLMLELYNIDRETLSNESLIRSVLDQYPGRVGMEKVSPVHLYDIETSNPLGCRSLWFRRYRTEPYQPACMA